MSKEWFHWYVKQATKTKNWAMYRDRFLCPCCYMPTLEERGSYDICLICFWEDDGQDSDDAEMMRGGPNSDYSLKEARDNFECYHTMYRPSDESHFKREMKDMPMKKEMYQAFSKAIQSGSDLDWSNAINIEAEYARRG